MEDRADAGRLPRQHGRRAARGSAPSWRRGLRGPASDTARAAGLTAALAFAVLVLGLVGAVFSSTSQNPGSSLTADALDAYVPTAATTSRTAATTCLVSWTPVASPPAGLTYDVTDGTGATVATGVAGTSASVTVPATAVTPTVKARRGAWVSSAATATGSPCNGFPDAPVLTLTPSDGAVQASWTAPAANGGTLASYTATISPAPGSGSATCTPSVPTTTCSWSSLTNGVTYTVSVTATSDVGTGPAGTATTIPYPSTVMTPANLKLWLDGADASTLFASSSCSGAAATTTVGCWKDKSTSADDATQSTPGNRPALATAAGRPVPSMDGTDDRLALTPSLLPNGSAASTAFVVAALDDPAPASSTYRLALAWGGTGTGAARVLGKNMSGTGMFGDLRFTGGMYPASYWQAAPSLLVHEVAASASRLVAWGAGTWATSAAVPSTGTSVAYVGADVTAGNGWYGRVPEVIVLGSTVTDSQRRAVEEYLSRKWSMTIAPGAPTAVGGSATTATSTSAVVGWTAPAYDGGAAVTSYTATAVPTAGGSTVTCTATAPSTSCTLTGLAGGGAQYAVTVTATNSAGAGPASSSATVFSGVPSAAGAKLWLAADDLDGNGLQAGTSESGLVSGAVQTWKDKSGGARDVTAPSSGERPTYTARTLNGYSVPTFNGSTILTGAGGDTDPYGITSDRSVFVVTRGRTFDTTGTAGGTTGSYLLGRASADTPVFMLNACGGNWAVRYRDDSNAGPFCLSGGSSPSANRVDAVEGLVNGTSLTTYVSGSPGSTATLASTLTGRPVSIGRHATATTTQDVDIAEVLLYSTSLTSSQRRAVEKYLAAKWGALLAPYVATGVTAAPTGTSGELAVSWTPPTDVGGSALTLYAAKTTSGGFSCTATPPATACTLSGLTNGTTYTVYVEAKNSTGTGERSATTTGVPSTAPGAPTGVAATTGDTTSSVSWTAPASNGGSAITGYTATAVPGTGGLPDVTCTSTASPCTLTGLVNGVLYTVSVTATNAVGPSAASSSVTVTPYPSSVMTSGATQLWLDAADPAYLFSNTACTTAAGTSGGSSVSCWKDRSTNARNAVAGTAAAVGASTMNGRSVLAFSGTSQLSTTRPASGDMTLFGVVRTSSTTGTSSSQWYAGAPVLDGSGTNVQSDYGFTLAGGVAAMGTGNPDTTARGAVSVANGAAHVVVGRRSGGGLEAAADGGTRGTATSTNTGALTASNSFKVGKNGSGAAYSGDVAEIVVLSSALSRADERTVLEYLARKWGGTISPQAPTAVTATGGQNAQAAVSWTAPAWSGGSAVTSYTVTSAPGGLTCSTASTSCTVSGLTNGTAYTFTVTATNAVGTGPASSASAAVTPSTVPGAPTAVAATNADTTSSVSWTAPASTGGAAITSYTATAVPSDGTLATLTCSAATSPCTVTGLTNGVTYSVTVRATNASGAGAASTAASAIPYPAGVLTTGRLELWLDGADPARMYAGSACSGAAATTTMGCWLDKSPNATSVTQGTTSQRPTLTTVNGRSVPGFDGSDDDMQADIGVLPTGTAPSTEFVVATMTDSSPATNGMRETFGWGWVSNGQGRGILKQANSSAVLSSTWNNNAVTSGAWSSSPQLAVAEHATPYVTLWTAGLPGVQSASSAFSTATVGASLAHANNGYHWMGPIPEVIVVSTTLTAAERRQVEEYLARKWSVPVTPAAPQGLTATPGTGTAALSWSAPAWNGGSAVTGYTATVSGGGTCTVTGTSASCSGVPAGSRTFTVTATNTTGTGPAVTTTATVS